MLYLIFGKFHGFDLAGGAEMKTAFPHAKLAWLASELQVYSKPYFLSFFKAGTVVCVKSLFILDWRRAGTASAVVKTVKREPFNVASRRGSGALGGPHSPASW